MMYNIFSVLPINMRHHRTRPPRKPTTKRPKTPKYEEYSDSTGSLSSAESFELPANPQERREIFETVRRNLLFSTGEGREPDPLPPLITIKRLIADLVGAKRRIPLKYSDVFIK